MRFGLKGSADIIGIAGPHGTFIAIECKSRTGKQSDAQRKFEAMVHRRGGIYILARTLDDVDRVLPPLLRKVTP